MNASTVVGRTHIYIICIVYYTFQLPIQCILSKGSQNETELPIEYIRSAVGPAVHK